MAVRQRVDGSVGEMTQDPPSHDPKRYDEDERATVNEWRRLSQLVVEFIGYLAVLGYLGWNLDEKYGWNGRGLFSGLMVGLAAWIYRVLRVTRGLFK